MGHFQRALSPELLDLNPSFIYQNTHLNAGETHHHGPMLVKLTITVSV